MRSLQYYAFRGVMRIAKATYDWGAPIEKQRALAEKNARFIKPPRELDTKRTSIGGVCGEWLTVSADSSRVLLHLHGGGYTLCSCATHRSFVSRLAAACGARAFLPEYRLAPEHPFPAALEDAVSVYRGLLRNGVPNQSIIISGDSAGGGLALASLISIRDSGDPLPAAAVCLSPWTDLALTGASLSTRAKKDPWLVPRAPEIQARLYCCGQDPRHPLISPLYADLAGLPPLLVQVGEDEILLSDSVRLAEKAREAGVEVTLDVWPGMWHVWQSLAPKLPEATEALEKIGRFLDGRSMGAQGPAVAARSDRGGRRLPATLVKGCTPLLLTLVNVRSRKIYSNF